MSTLSMVLWGLAAVLLVMYIMRRRARLRSDD
jgi:hypothetical protein